MSAELPDPRRYKGQRVVRIGLRTVHIGGACMVLGAAHFAEVPPTAMTVLILSGLGIALDDLYKWGTVYLGMVQSWVVGTKLTLLLVAASVPEALLPCLWTALVLGSVVSHSPGRLRHWRPLP